MGKIIILDENTANKIAAGEVIERPSSVVKELVENSIDAGADSISVEIRNGGISFIRVTDNGGGIAEDDVQIAFERHATSKIRRSDDLASITSMGFRGEALASIAAVSDVQVSTRVKSSVQGVSIRVKGGSVLDVGPAGCPTGTSITVRELFFNTPARYKFLKKDSTEAANTADMLGRIALGYPEISFRLTSNGSPLLHTPGNGDLKSAIFSVYGAETAKNLLEVEYKDEHASVKGYVGKAEIARSNRNHQSVYINRRYIRSRTVTTAIDTAYSTFLMKNRYPFILLDISVNPATVDVNVHPAKMDIKFSNEQDIFRAVYHAINGALLSLSEVRTLPASYMRSDPTGFAPDVRGESKAHQSPSYRLNENFNTRPAYTQQDFEAVKTELDRKREEAISGKQQAPMSGVRQEMVGESEEAYSELQEPIMRSSLFAGARIIGQAFATYILLEGNDELFLLDQHAAHERIRYEELKEAYAKNEPVSQLLMEVVHIELTAGEYQYAMNETDFFSKLGYTYEAFGSNSIILRSVPYSDNACDIREMFHEILDFVINGCGNDKNNIADEALYTLACKSAVKASKKLDEKEVTQLLNRLAQLENPYTCPHGRPSILKLRRYELEKLFKRVV